MKSWLESNPFNKPLIKVKKKKKTCLWDWWHAHKEQPKDKHEDVKKDIKSYNVGKESKKI